MSIHEECGVFGVFCPKPENTANMAYYGLYALQHRGQESCGIVVNEGLPCVETDLMETLDRIAPLDAPYAHAHFLPSYGATGNNSCGHIKSMICGNSCFFPVQDGHIVCGSAQNIYLAEFDGPQKRKVYVEVLGE